MFWNIFKILKKRIRNNAINTYHTSQSKEKNCTSLLCVNIPTSFRSHFTIKKLFHKNFLFYFRYRLIANASFQKPLAYLVIALIAYLTKDWQHYFIFLNLVTSPTAIAFMLFLESPRWLVASGRLEEACEVWIQDLVNTTTNFCSSSVTVYRCLTIWHILVGTILV